MPLTHVDDAGNARMVDVSHKPLTAREARAEGFLCVGPAALAALQAGPGKKGDPMFVAQLAGIQAAKRASDLIPLCHPLLLTGVEVHLTLEADASRVRVEATVRTTGPTGVEMEALTAVSAALLTLYDMLKAVDRGMILSGQRLLHKSGGASGTWHAAS